MSLALLHNHTCQMPVEDDMVHVDIALPDYKASASPAFFWGQDLLGMGYLHAAANVSDQCIAWGSQGSCVPPGFNITCPAAPLAGGLLPRDARPQRQGRQQAGRRWAAGCGRHYAERVRRGWHHPKTLGVWPAVVVVAAQPCRSW